MAKYEKPACTNHELLNHWEEKGLKIGDRGHADTSIRFMGYYRLSVYARYFRDVQATGKPFRSGTCFEDIIRLYQFDRNLRLLTIDAIERIEVAVRSVMVSTLSRRHEPWWYQNETLFTTGLPDPGVVTLSTSTGLPLQPSFVHADLIKKIEEYLYIKEDGPSGNKRPTRGHNEEFIKHYYSKYGDPLLPPSWIVAEVLTFGDWARMFNHLKFLADRVGIAQPFGVDQKILGNWLLAFNGLRNFCAHHGRLWNRRFVVAPMIAKRHSGFVTDNKPFFAMAVAMFELLKRIDAHTDWNQRLAELLARAPAGEVASMGFPANWAEEPFWGVTAGSPTPAA